MSKAAPTPEEYRTMKGIPEIEWSEIGPELLEALKELESAVIAQDPFNERGEQNSGNCLMYEARRKCNLVIAKAEGRS